MFPGHRLVTFLSKSKLTTPRKTRLISHHYSSLNMIPRLIMMTRGGASLYLITGRPVSSGQRCGWAERTPMQHCTHESAGSCWGLRPRCRPAAWGKGVYRHLASVRDPGHPGLSAAPVRSRLVHQWPVKTHERSPARPWTLDWWRQMESLKEQRSQRHNI